MIEWANQELYLSGKIDYHNAETYYQRGLAEIQRHKTYPIVINLSKLEYSSTLTLAVLLQWLRQTPKAQGLVFKAVPEKLNKIIKSCHLLDDLQFA